MIPCAPHAKYSCEMPISLALKFSIGLDRASKIMNGSERISQNGFSGEDE